MAVVEKQSDERRGRNTDGLESEGKQNRWTETATVSLV